MTAADEEKGECRPTGEATPQTKPLKDIPRALPVGPVQQKAGLSVASMCLGIGAWAFNCVSRFGSMGQAGPSSAPASPEERFGETCASVLVPVGLAVAAIVLGYRARSQRQSGLGMAKAGVILGVAYLAALVSVVVGALILKRW